MSFPAVPVIDSVTDWRCPECGLTEQTVNKPNRYHNCPRMGGLTTPLLRAGTKAKIERVMREDYTNGDEIRLDDAGRAVMAIKVTRDDGQDAFVFAPTAKGTT